ncbi:unnamed protein product, partial [Porites lobata]
VFCSSVGVAASCSIETLQEKAKTCVNGFFDNLKKDRHQDCRELYSSKVKHCIIKVIDDCRNRTDSKTVAIMEKSSKTWISRWQYYCKDGMLDSFKGVKKLQNCPDTTLEKIGKCASSFYKKFKENKGSRSLCRKFTKAKKCIRTTLERNCDKNSWVKNAAKRYQDPHNPYCPGWVDLKRKPDGRTWTRSTDARRTWLFTAIKTNLNTIEGTWSDPSIAETFEPTKNKFIAMA